MHAFIHLYFIHAMTTADVKLSLDLRILTRRCAIIYCPVQQSVFNPWC